MIYPVSMFDRFDRMTAEISRGSQPASNNPQTPDNTARLAAPPRESLAVHMNESANAGMFSSVFGPLHDETPPGGTGQARGRRVNDQVITQSQVRIFQLADLPTPAALPQERLMERGLKTAKDREVDANPNETEEEQIEARGAFVENEQARMGVVPRSAQTQVTRQRGVVNYVNPSESLFGEGVININA